MEVCRGKKGEFSGYGVEGVWLAPGKLGARYLGLEDSGKLGEDGAGRFQA